jgi:hypothetical protein
MTWKDRDVEDKMEVTLCDGLGWLMLGGTVCVGDVEMTDYVTWHTVCRMRQLYLVGKGIVLDAQDETILTWD